MGKIFLEAGELTWREKELARGQLASLSLLLWAEENRDWEIAFAEIRKGLV